MTYLPQSTKPLAPTEARASPWLGLKQSCSFFEDDSIRQILARATRYAQAGVCVHFTGTAGLGKTTLALRVAEALDRPVAMMTGHDWLSARDFLGGEVGSKTSTLVDRYVQSVRRTEKEIRTDWGSSILARAMKRGETLVYDEFTRASPEANATLLSVLEEGVLISTDPSSPETQLQAHPDFRVILTSNPHDYVAVNTAPDALLDRVVTMDIPEPSPETLIGILNARTGLPEEICGRIVALVRELRSSVDKPTASTLRSALMITRIAAPLARAEILTEAELIEIASDVLVGRGLASSMEHIAAVLTQSRAA